MSRGFDEYEKCIYVGGLRRDLAAGELESHIRYLFECIGISVKKSNIQINKNPKSGSCFGFVNLEDMGRVKYVLDHLSTEANRSKVRFDFSMIQDPNKQLMFDCKNPPKQPPFDSMAASVSGLAPDRYYSFKELLGNEAGTVEFKQGHFVTKDHKYVLRDNVGKYVCAFLNTAGGTLKVGVDYDGQVIGVTCDQQEEDKHRITIDQAIIMISPFVLPALYTVQFVRVLDKKNSFASNRKVLEVKVKATDDRGVLYLFRGDAFVRRGGSVQMLKAKDIQDWERKRLEQSLESKEEVMHKLLEKTEQLQLLQQHVSKLEREQYNKRDNERKDAMKKSEVCSIL